MSGWAIKVVGELTDYIVQGQSEILLRKTVGPLADFSSKTRLSGGVWRTIASR